MDAPQAAGQYGFQPNIGAQAVAEQVRHAGNQAIDVDGFGPERLLTRKGQQTLGQGRGALGAFGGRVEIAARPRVLVAEPAPQQVERAHDNGQHIVEVVGDAAGQLPDRLHLLRLAQRIFGVLQGLGLQLFGGDVAAVGIDGVAFGRAAPRNPARRAVSVHVTVFKARNVAAHLGAVEIGLGLALVVMPQEVGEMAADGFGRVATKYGRPSRADRLKDPIEADDNLHVQCLAPYPVDIGGTFGDLMLQGFVQVAQGLLGDMAFRDIGPFDENPHRRAGGILDRLIDEVEITDIGCAVGADQIDLGAERRERFAGRIDAVHKGDKALFDDFRQGFGQGLADNVAIADQVEIGCIGVFEDVVRSAQNGHEGRRLVEQLHQAFALRLEFALPQHLCGRLDHRIHHAADTPGLVADRRIAEGEIGLFGLAVAAQRDEIVFEEAGLARHGLFGDRAHVVPDLDPGHAIGLTQGRRLAAQKRDIGVVENGDQVVAPEQALGKFRRQHHVDGDLEHGGPGVDRPQRGRRPIEMANLFGHGAVVGRKGADALAFGHSASATPPPRNRGEATPAVSLFEGKSAG